MKTQISSVPLADTLEGCRAILAGECDDWAESAFYMVGDLAEAKGKQAASASKPEPAPVPVPA